MLLRDYQTDAIDKLRESLRSGKRRPVIQAPTGAGKTVIAAAIIEMARAKGKRVLFCVPALELINQTVDRFARNGILDVGDASPARAYGWAAACADLLSPDIGTATNTRR